DGPHPDVLPPYPPACGPAPDRHLTAPRQPDVARRIGYVPTVAEKLAEIREVRSDLIRRVFRFGTNAVVATVCSQATFIVLYGPVGTSTTVASTLAWLAGAIPNYWLNRSWTWGRRGRPSVRREILPYAVIVLGTLGLAILATGVGASLLDRTSLSSTV